MVHNAAVSDRSPTAHHYYGKVQAGHVACGILEPHGRSEPSGKRRDIGDGGRVHALGAQRGGAERGGHSQTLAILKVCVGQARSAVLVAGAQGATILNGRRK